MSLAVVALSTVSFAQQVYTAKDYAQAERWMSYNVSGLVKHTVTRPTYLADGRVFFADPGTDGTVYRIADPVKGTVTAAFDNTKLAAALSAAGGRKIEPAKLSVTEYEGESTGFAVNAGGGRYHCDAAGETCTAEAGAKPAAGRRRGGSTVNLAPDGKLGVFIRDNNLWLRTIATGAEKPLTTDGVKDFGYATDNAGWTHSDGAVATWSADGRKLATFQLDERKTGMMYLVPTTNRHPVLEAWHYPLVGDKDVTMIEPVVIDVASGAVVRLKVPPLEHRSMECDDVACEGRQVDGRGLFSRRH